MADYIVTQTYIEFIIKDKAKAITVEVEIQFLRSRDRHNKQLAFCVKMLELNLTTNNAKCKKNNKITRKSRLH
jgi:hypothetical protein